MWLFKRSLLIPVFWLLLTVSPTEASHIPENVPEHVGEVINKLDIEHFHFLYDKDSVTMKAFFTICRTDSGQYGVVPGKTTKSSLCLIYDSDRDRVSSPDRYQTLLETSEAQNNHTGMFLENQTDPNPGIWIYQQDALCYSLSGESTSRIYCLSSKATAVNTAKKTSQPDKSIVNFTLFGIGMFAALGMFAAIGYFAYLNGIDEENGYY